MTEIRFYHLQTQSIDQALPQILSKAIAGGKRAVVKMADKKEVERFDQLLWTFRPDSFLPHGCANDDFAADQPIWLTDKDENPNNAELLILTEGAETQNAASYALCCEMFDGRMPESVAAARQKWKAYKDEGHEVTYWQQNERGGWDQKA